SGSAAWIFLTLMRPEEQQIPPVRLRCSLHPPPELHSVPTGNGAPPERCEPLLSRYNCRFPRLFLESSVLSMLLRDFPRQAAREVLALASISDCPNVSSGSVSGTGPSSNSLAKRGPLGRRSSRNS